ncbi:MAG: NADH-quinone oxidoreductase subunit L [Caldiserica bacterium]|jgi:NADH-quinone oxidoreductase subunit L|nr:NADH-quinone oxidoreductase subunit L [Caldisericota bacterium]MDH7562065.1 NADH-quinone oxidoreductase subunit L [Caldisericota bacterium]
MNSEIIPLLLLLIPMGGAALVPLINLFYSKAVPLFSVFVGLTTAVIGFFLPGRIGSPAVSFEWLPGIIKTGFQLDTLSVVPALIATWIGFLVLVYSLGYMKQEENLSRYYSLTLLFIASMIGMSLADNFLALFFFWEVMGVCSYALIGFFYKDPKAASAGVKAFLTTRIGDIGLLAAILLIYAFTGTFNISQGLAGAGKIALPLLNFVAFGFILGAVGKSAQLPLHVWLPDAMEAPTTISALIHAATMVNAGVYLLARVFPLLSLVPNWLVLIQWIGALTALLGSLLATFHYDLKRILAYSTISQLGYMVFAVGVGGIFASQFHLFSHAIFKALLFLCAGAVIHELKTRDIREMGGLQKYMPITGATFFIGALALMGLPILNGFFSKDMILEEGLLSGSWGPLIVAIIAALLTAYYSLRTTSMVFWGKRRSSAHAVEAPWVMTGPLSLLALGSIVSWFLVGPLTSSWARTVFEVHYLDWLELLKETFSSKAFLITLGVIILGFLIFFFRGKWGPIREKAPGFFKAVSVGLGFDILYGWISKQIYGFSNLLSAFFEEKVMEGINLITGRGSVALSIESRKMQTGDLHWNLLYIFLTLIIILGLILW